jgi:hypothetical protein
MKNDEKVTDEELAEYLATHDREGLTLDELSDHDCASIRLAPRLARALAALRAPVDVEGEMGHIANAITRAVVETAFLNEEGEVVIRLNTLAAAAVVRSHVERAAQLAREAAELRQHKALHLVRLKQPLFLRHIERSKRTADVSCGLLKQQVRIFAKIAQQCNGPCPRSINKFLRQHDITRI